LHEIFICKIVCHHFQPRLIPPLCTKLGYLLYGVYIWYNYRCILSMVIYSCFNSLDVGVGPSPVLFLFLQWGIFIGHHFYYLNMKFTNYF
jgi:hypothetical protein